MSTPALVPDTLWSLLTKQMGLEPAYVRDRIMTVFLDGSPVDDLETAVVKDGAVIGLAAAMPGLAGAVLRRGGILSTLRDTITLKPGFVEGKGAPGRVVLKLFNLIAAEAGPDVLGRGVFLDARVLRDMLSGEDAKDLMLDGKPAKLKDLDGLEGEVLARLAIG